jgi:hypothetical protein
VAGRLAAATESAAQVALLRDMVNRCIQNPLEVHILAQWKGVPLESDKH